jgi:hypothetical protein
MPYIKPQLRDKVKDEIVRLIYKIDGTNVEDREGLMTYIIYKLLVETYGYSDDVPKWNKRAEALKVLESAKLEYYRRIMAPYEDKAIQRNGDIL